ncbi:sensor histidine kinase [Halorutilales archaeon Cl-col2-1]
MIGSRLFDVYVYAVVPLAFLSVSLGYSVLKTYRLRSWKPVFLVALLSIMAAHQTSETYFFISTPMGLDGTETDAVLETTETVANVAASLSAYFVLGIVGDERRAKESTAVLSRVMRHDLRNRLTVIKGYIQLAEEEARASEENEIAEYLDKPVDEIENLSQTADKARRLEDVLEERTTPRGVNLREVVSAEVEDARRRFDDAEIYLRNKAHTKVRADDNLGEALRAVIENGVVHNDKETPRVEVDIEENRFNVVLSVRDNGPGIAEEDREKILGRDERSQLHHGEGISLFVVDSLVDEYGGSIWIEDDGLDGEGSAFKIRLWKSVEGIL